MKKIKLAVLLLLITVGASAQNILTSINTASDFFAKLEEGKYQEAQDFFDVSVKEKLPPETLKTMWANLKTNLGEFESVNGAQNKVQDEFQIVILDCKFSKSSQPFQFVFNKDQKMVGFFILPKPTTNSYKLPIYTDCDKFTEKLVTIKSGTHELPAMITLPKDTVNCPVVVFVHGSGPGDMDESVGAQKPFKDLAIGLASQGIASVRYVKRTALYAGEFSGAFTTKEEVLDDALAVIAYTKKIVQVDSQNVYLFGHSLGGMLAPKIATLAPDLKGIILAAAPARKLQDISIEQNNYFFNIEKDTTKDGKKYLDLAIKDLTASKSITATSLPADSVILGLPAAYWADLNMMDQVALAKKIPQRIFVIQGGNDFQVSTKDFTLWSTALKGKKGFDSKLYPMLNHLFSFVPEKGTTAQYQEAGNVDQPIVDDLASWILQR